MPGEVVERGRSPPGELHISENNVSIHAERDDFLKFVAPYNKNATKVLMSMIGEVIKEGKTDPKELTLSKLYVLTFGFNKL